MYPMLLFYLVSLFGLCILNETVYFSRNDYSTEQLDDLLKHQEKDFYTEFTKVRVLSILWNIKISENVYEKVFLYKKNTDKSANPLRAVKKIEVKDKKVLLYKTLEEIMNLSKISKLDFSGLIKMDAYFFDTSKSKMYISVDYSQTLLSDKVNSMTPLFEAYRIDRNNDIHKQKYYYELLNNLQLAIKLAKTLSFLHSNNIIQNNVNPGQIIVTNDNIPKFFNFAQTRIETNLTKTVEDLQNAGEEGYIAPESKVHTPHGVESDVFSFGITLIELFSGVKVPEEVLKCIYDNKFTFENFQVLSIYLPILDINFLDFNFEKLVYKTLLFDPYQRYTVSKVLSILEEQKLFLELEYNMLFSKPGLFLK